MSLVFLYFFLERVPSVFVEVSSFVEIVQFVGLL